jgi:hypothetical protein
MPGRQLWDEAGVHAAICIVAALLTSGRGSAGRSWTWPPGVMASQDDMIHRFSVAGLVMQRRANFAHRRAGRGRWPTGV